MSHIEALQNKDTYMHPVQEVKHVQTASSHVFLTGEFAYKLCKPVDFGFFDFTTLEARKEQLEKELYHNSKLSDIYHEVLPIYEQGFSGNTIIDFALKMQQVDHDTADNALHKVTSSHIQQLAHIMGEFHTHAPISEEIASFGSIEMISYNWNEHFEQTSDEFFPRDQFHEMKDIIQGFIKNNEDLLHTRHRENKIKHCHGDFHLGNVFLSDKPIVFDSLVFNKRFPCCDVVSEVAFMMMDLEHRGKPELATEFWNTYKGKTQDYEGEHLLDFYKSYRAYIRAKIAYFGWKGSGSDKDKKEALDYFATSYKYAKLLA